MLISDSAERTAALGAALGAVLPPGACVGLVGELGAGKTALAAGIGRGLGVAEPLRSPSYLLCCEHRGRSTVLHLDAYFEARMEALLHEGLATRFGGDTVLIVEWADRLASWWPPDRLEIRLGPADAPERRRLGLQALGPRSEEILAAFLGSLPAGMMPEMPEPAPRGAR